MLVLLDVAIGLIFLYLLLSLLCSAALEVIESFLRFRAKDLSKAVARMLGSEALREKLFSSPLIKSLRSGNGPPSYLPPEGFALALLDAVGKGELQGKQPATPAAAFNAAELRRVLSADPTAELNRALLAILDASSDELHRFRSGVEGWFNSAMERASGAFKRRTQWMLVALGFVLAVAVNADTVEMARALSSNGALREAVAKAAGSYLEKSLTAEAAAPAGDAKKVFDARLNDVRQLDALGLPLGWGGRGPIEELKQATGVKMLTMFLGWLLTAIAVSFGAPFWFDLLKRVASIRGTLKPADEKK